MAVEGANYCMKNIITRAETSKDLLCISTLTR